MVLEKKALPLVVGAAKGQQEKVETLKKRVPATAKAMGITKPEVIEQALNAFDKQNNRHWGAPLSD